MSKNKTRFLIIVAAVFVAFSVIACGKAGNFDVAVRETIATGGNHTVGLQSDGTVFAVGKNADGQCDVREWTDIVAISAGEHLTVGLKSDGTVVAVGDNDYVSEWADIVAISAGYYHTVGLKSDGTVVAVGKNADGQCDVDSWTDIKLPKK